MTEYVILKRHPSTETELWEMTFGTFKASSSKRALAIAGDQLGKQMPEGDYVAVPVRNWKPLPLSVETIAKVTIG